jgi:hypothetical protein
MNHKEHEGQYEVMRSNKDLLKVFAISLSYSLWL